MELPESDTDSEVKTSRPARVKKLSLKAMESLYMQKLKSKRQDPEPSSDEDSSEYECLDERQKPAILGTSSTVDGDKIFSFQKRKARNLLLQKVSEVKEQMVKTPRAVRSVIKKRIARGESSEDDFDFSDSGSEYERSKSSESESSETENSEISKESDSDSSVKETSVHVTRRRTQVKPTKVTFPVRKNVRKRNQTKKYVIKTDDYFSNHASKKVITSDHTLDKLKTPRLPQDQLRSILEKMKLSDEHEKCVNELSLTNGSYFNKWLLLLQENFNILLYGLGSKRYILKEFHDQCLKDLPVIVVNGFFPTVTIKDVLDAIILDLLELKENPINVYDACDSIEQEFSYIPDTHLYLIVHNIEGDMLKNKKAQDVLSKLASIKNIHLIASMDHINGPLIWDHSKLSKYNFSWWDVTSFLPYIEETSFESSMFIQSGGTLALSSLNNVFLSLTPNSRGIYLIIVKHQLDNVKHQYYQGIAFKDLYWSCREAFLVSSDLALRAQLNEFVDHKMVKFKRSVDGTEFLTIPISNAILKKFLEEQND